MPYIFVFQSLPYFFHLQVLARKPNLELNTMQKMSSSEPEMEAENSLSVFLVKSKKKLNCFRF